MRRERELGARKTRAHDRESGGTWWAETGTRIEEDEGETERKEGEGREERDRVGDGGEGIS